MVSVLVNMPPLTDCRSEAPFTAKQYWFRATQTVVQPWRGLHHTYGIFSVPDQYKRHRLYTARLIIQGFTEEFPESSPEGGIIYNGRAEAGITLSASTSQREQPGGSYSRDDLVT